MKQSTWILIYTILGTTFWIPSIVIHGIRGGDFGASRSDIILITLLPIITAVLTLQILARSQVGPLSRASIASWMLLGIWFFGPFCMMISASFSGGGFLSSEVWRSIALAALLFVPYTFVMSTYDATLGALLVVTIWFFVIGAVGLTRRFRPIAKSAG
jgi:hypothetical protein